MANLPDIVTKGERQSDSDDENTIDMEMSATGLVDRINKTDVSIDEADPRLWQNLQDTFKEVVSEIQLDSFGGVEKRIDSCYSPIRAIKYLKRKHTLRQTDLFPTF